MVRSSGVSLVIPTLTLLVLGVLSVATPSALALTQDELHVETREPWSPVSTSYPNKECVKHTFITRPAKLFQKQQTYSSECAIKTNFGITDGNWVQLHGTTVAGKFKKSTQGGFVPIPRSDNVMIKVGVSDHKSYYFYRDIMKLVTPSVNSKGEVTYEMKSGEISNQIWPSYTNEGAVRFLDQSLQFSSNGKWLSGVANNQLVILNTETFEVKVIADTSIKYREFGQQVFYTAVSDNGRHVYISTSEFKIYLYDLLCPHECKPTEIFDLIYQHNEDVGRVPPFARFIGDHTLEVISNHKQKNLWHKFRSTIPLNGSQAYSMDYLALGDSFASGEGAYEYRTETNFNDNRCHISRRSYPYVLADKLSLGFTESVACSGAKMMDVITKDRLTYNELPDGPQSKNKIESVYDLNIFSNYLPGYRPQHLFLNEHKPRVVTISTVGNDIEFTKKIIGCAMPGECYESYEERLSIVYEINGKFDELVSMYELLKSKHRNSIYALGYPSIAAENGNCAINVYLSNEDIITANKLIKHLNMVVETAARRAGVIYIDVYETFNGRRLCETEGYNTAVNGLSAGLGTPLWFGPIAKESFHPNDLGHNMYATTIAHKTNNFTQVTPNPDPSATLPAVSDSVLLQGLTPTPATVYLVKNQDIANSETLFQAQTFPVNSRGIDTQIIQPGSTVTFELHSDPITLGSTTVQPDGTFAYDIRIPEDVPPGFHTLHMYGTTVTGEQFDYYDYMYIGHSPEDFDGDGILNKDEACLIGEPSGTDTDQDGIDDGCDGFIGEAPNAQDEHNPVPLPDIKQLPDPTTGPDGGKPNPQPSYSDPLGSERTPPAIPTPGTNEQLIPSPPIEITQAQPSLLQPAVSPVRRQASTSIQNQSTITTETGVVAGVSDENERPLTPPAGILNNVASMESTDPEPTNTNPQLLLAAASAAILAVIVGVLFFKPVRRN